MRASDAERPAAPVGESERISESRAREEELERAVARLRDTEERYRTLVERLPVVAYSEDLEFDNPATEYVAPGIERLLGFTVAEWIGGPNLWRTLLHPGDRDRVLGEWDRLATGERSSSTMEYRIFRKDGRLVWLLDDAFVLDWRGRPHIEGMLQDITARKESEEALARQARELTRANARLTELDELKTSFVITASHELRTPLTAVIGFMATLAERWNDLEEDERQEFVQTVERQGRRLLRLVEDLLALSRLDAGDLRTRPILMELAPLVDRAVSGFVNDGIALDVGVPGGLRVEADPDRVVQILGGLIANATKYGAPPVRVEAEPDGRSILIRVIDRGPGVPADLRARLFERFARSEQQKESVQPGFGLGLATARELARAMKGDVWYEHDPGGDAAFCLRLRKAPSLRARTPTTPLQGIRPARRPA